MADTLAGYLKEMGAAPNYAGLGKQATRQAGAVTQQALDEINRRQQRLRTQAALEAQQINQATLAGVNVLDRMHLPQQVAQSYAQAGAAQRGAAEVYSGDLRNQMTQEAERVNQSLAALGAPGQAPNQGAAAANVLYGLGDTAGRTWERSAPSAVAAAGQVPLTLAQTGQQGVLGALAGGRQQAGAFNDNIADLIAKFPELRADIFAKLTSATDKRRQDAIDTALKLAKMEGTPKIHYGENGEILQVNPDGKIIVRRAATPDPVSSGYKVTTDAATGQKVLYDPATGRVIAGIGGAAPAGSVGGSPSTAAGTAVPVLDTTNSNYNHVDSDQYGNPINYGTKKKPVYRAAPGWKMSPNGKSVVRDPSYGGGKSGGGLTSNQISDLVEGWFNGNPTSVTLQAVDADGKTVFDDEGLPEMVTRTEERGVIKNAAQAVARLVGYGVKPKAAMDAVYGVYGKPQAAGKPLAPQAYALSAAKYAKGLGKTEAEVRAALAAVRPKLSLAAINRAIDIVYGRRPVAVTGTWGTPDISAALGPQPRSPNASPFTPPPGYEAKPTSASVLWDAYRREFGLTG